MIRTAQAIDQDPEDLSELSDELADEALDRPDTDGRLTGGGATSFPSPF